MKSTVRFGIDAAGRVYRADEETAEALRYDEFFYGSSFSLLKDDGSIERLDPRDVMIRDGKWERKNGPDDRP